MLIAGIVAFAILDYLGYVLAGVAIYWSGFAGMFVVRWYAPVSLADERDQAIEQRASYDTLRIAAVALIAGAPAIAVLEAADVYTAPSTLDGAVWGFVALFAVFGVTYLVRRYGP